MNQDSFKQQKLEHLAKRVEIATPKDWQAYKDLRLEAIQGEDAEMFGATSEAILIEKSRTDQEWMQDLSHKNMFVVMSWVGSEVVGMGVAIKIKSGSEIVGIDVRKIVSEDEVWRMRSGYMKPKYRGDKIGQKMFALRLKEILKRGGKKAIMGVKAINSKSIHIAESFGFSKSGEVASGKGFWMELEDIHNPETIRKINEVLNEG